MKQLIPLVQITTTARPPTPSTTSISLQTPIPQTPSIIVNAGDDRVNNNPIDATIPSPTVANGIDNNTNITSEETSQEENRYRSKLIIGLSVSLAIIIITVVFFIILMVWIMRRHKKQKFTSERMPEVPFIVGSLQSDQIDIVQHLYKLPTKTTASNQLFTLNKSTPDVEYFTALSPALPPVYDYVGTKN